VTTIELPDGTGRCPTCTSIVDDTFVVTVGCERCNHTGRAHLWQITVMAADTFKKPVRVQFGPPGTMPTVGMLDLDETAIVDLLRITAGHPEVIIRDQGKGVPIPGIDY
jgi:hypothetical protein